MTRKKRTKLTPEELKAQGYLTLGQLVDAIRRERVFVGAGTPENLIRYLQNTGQIESPEIAPRLTPPRVMVAWYPAHTVEQIRKLRRVGNDHVQVFWEDVAEEFHRNGATETEAMFIEAEALRIRAQWVPSSGGDMRSWVEETAAWGLSQGLPPLTQEERAELEQTVESWRADAEQRHKEFIGAPPERGAIALAVWHLYPDGKELVKRNLRFVTARLFLEFEQIKRALEAGDTGGAYTSANHAAELSSFVLGVLAQTPVVPRSVTVPPDEEPPR